MAEFYVTEERAMAPGISGNWPKIIQKPGNKNGRLVKLEGLQKEMDEIIEELNILNNQGAIPEQQRRRIGDVLGTIRSIFK